MAVVGASDDQAKWGHWMARGAIRGSGRRRVFLVNRRADTVLGLPAHRSLADLPEPPELVVVAVPPAALDATVDEAIEAGARGVVIITAGFADGDAGGARDRALAERARAAGVLLLGPNCMGVFDAGEQLDLASEDLPAGRIGLISQSGNLALEVGMRAAEAGLGFSRFVSVGNQADVGIPELVAEFAAHPETELIAVYAEDVRDGRAFAAAAAEAGKPVVLLAIAHGEATARAVASHTGALASDAAAIDAACARGGDRARAHPVRADRRGRRPAARRPARRAPDRGAVRRRRSRRDRGCARRGGRARRAAAERGARGGAARRPAADRGGRRTRSTSPAAASRTCGRSTARRRRCCARARSTRCC